MAAVLLFWPAEVLHLGGWRGFGTRLAVDTLPAARAGRAGLVAVLAGQLAGRPLQNQAHSAHYAH